MFIFASTSSDQVFLRAVGVDGEQQKQPRSQGIFLAWGCSENYVNLALAGFFAIKMKCFAPSNLADTA